MSGEMLLNLQPGETCGALPQGVFQAGRSTEVGLVLWGVGESDAKVKGE